MNFPSSALTHALCHSLRKLVVSNINRLWDQPELKELRECQGAAQRGLRCSWFVLFQANERSFQIDLLPIYLAGFAQTNAAVIKEDHQGLEIERKTSKD
jgi:hypothetical protein